MWLFWTCVNSCGSNISKCYETCRLFSHAQEELKDDLKSIFPLSFDLPKKSSQKASSESFRNRKISTSWANLQVHYTFWDSAEANILFHFSSSMEGGFFFYENVSDSIWKPAGGAPDMSVICRRLGNKCIKLTIGFLVTLARWSFHNLIFAFPVAAL